MQIYFCERCGKRVSDVDIEKGRGFSEGTVVYCSECMAEAATEGKTAAEAPDAGRLAGRAARKGREVTSRGAARRGTAPERVEQVSGMPRWLYFVIFGVAAALVLVLFLVFGGPSHEAGPASSPEEAPAEERPEAREQTGLQEEAIPIQDDAGEPAQPAGPAKPAEPEQPAFVLSASPSMIRPTGALLLADFDYITAEVDAVSTPHQAEIKALDGNQAVVVDKVFGDVNKAASVKLRFSKPLNLGKYRTLAVTMVAGPQETRVSVGVNQAGSVKYLETTEGEEAVDVGPQWAGYDFQLDEDMDNVYGVVFRFNAAGGREGFIFSADEILVHDRRMEAAASAEAIPVTEARPETSSPPSGEVVYSCDFEGPAPGWNMSLAEIVSLPDGRRVLKSRAESGDQWSARRTYVEGYAFEDKHVFVYEKGLRLELDYYISGGGGDAPFKVRVYGGKDEEGRENHDYNVDPVEDKWTHLSLDLGKTVGTRSNEPVEEGARIHELKFYAGRAGEDTEFMLDNIRVVKAAEESRGEDGVILSAGFDESVEGWTGGVRVTRNTFSGTEGAFKAEPKGEHSACAATLEKWVGDQVFEAGSDMSISFAYFLEGVDFLKVNLYSKDKEAGLSYEITDPVQGEWTSVTLPFSRLVPSEEGFHLEPGDKVCQLEIRAGETKPPHTFLIDEVVVQSGAAAPAAADASYGEPAAESRKITEPTKMQGVGGGEAIVLLAADFDSGTDGFAGGKRITDNTFNGSPGAFKADYKAGAKYFQCSIHTDKWLLGKPKQEGFVKVGHNMKITFAYYLEGADYIQVQYWNVQKDGNFYVRKKAQQGAWSIFQVDFTDGEPNNHDGKKTEPGDWLNSLSLFSGSDKKETTFIIDNVVIHEGDLPANMGAALARKIAETRFISGDPMTDGFYLNGEVLGNLKSCYRKDAVEAGTIAILGDDLANSSSFILPLLRDGEPLEEKDLMPRLTFAADRHPIVKLYSKMERGFRRGRPEVLVVMAGYSDITMFAQEPEAMASELNKVVEKALSEGVCPVLVTLPRPRMMRDPFASKFGDWNKELLDLAKQRRVPLIEASLLLNRSEERKSRLFSRDKLRSGGYDIINEVFQKVYQAIEFKVFERGETPLETPVSAGETPAGGDGGKAEPEVEPEAIEEIEEIEI